MVWSAGVIIKPGKVWLSGSSPWGGVQVIKSPCVLRATGLWPGQGVVIWLLPLGGSAGYKVPLPCSAPGTPYAVSAPHIASYSALLARVSTALACGSVAHSPQIFSCASVVAAGSLCLALKPLTGPCSGPQLVGSCALHIEGSHS